MMPSSSTAPAPLLASTELPTYTRWPVTLVRGQGSTVWDDAGKSYLDLYGGHAVASTGHAHPEVARAVSEQAGTLLFYSNVVAVPVRTRASDAVARHAPGTLGKVFFVNSGTEANENAMRLARRATGRQDVLSFHGGFHGRTADAISAAGLEKYRALGRPNVPGHRLAPFGDLAAAEAAIDDRVAAVLIEPIQSLAGVVTAPGEYFQGLRRLCSERGAKLIYDEVQTGFGRTGTFFWAGRHGVLPDLITLAKGIASGVPMGAVLVAEDIAAGVKPEDYGTTFGGGPLASAACEATVRVIEEERLLENVLAGSRRIRDGLAKIGAVKEVRGEGFLLGIVLDRPGKPVREALLARGILVGGSDLPDVLRLLPPLVLTAGEIDRFLSVLQEIL
ncbi:MAG TPA: aminotransferase class III-fold pyridoxal phosphate-dependent enzyme [Thermoanaerobaculia bacterium]|nr:aminotransferase class III-fold pyridoxal phosphate-dependent enzyme [Thermoanaerobaculia bacterium]